MKNFPRRRQKDKPPATGWVRLLLPLAIAVLNVLLSPEPAWTQPSNENADRAIEQVAATATASAAPNADLPGIVQAPLAPAIAESLSALVEEVKASRREQRIAEARWWPPSASWALVYAVVFFLAVAAWQLKAISRQSNIATRTLAVLRKHMAALERAKIPLEPIVHSMALHQFGRPEFYISYELTNAGRADAQVVEQRNGVWLTDGGAVAKTSYDYCPQSANYNVAPNQHVPITVKPAQPLSAEERGKVLEEKLQIYVGGCIRYRDDAGEYRTEFVCRYDGAVRAGNFVLVADRGCNFAT